MLCHFVGVPDLRSFSFSFISAFSKPLPLNFPRKSSTYSWRFVDSRFAFDFALDLTTVVA